jgi:serine/threonine protein kinase
VAGPGATLLPRCSCRPFPTEVWSLGVSLYMFVFGEPPFAAITMAKLYEAIRTQELQLEGGQGRGRVAGRWQGGVAQPCVRTWQRLWQYIYAQSDCRAAAVASITMSTEFQLPLAVWQWSHAIATDMRQHMRPSAVPQLCLSACCPAAGRSPRLSPELLDLLRAMLEKDPERRLSLEQVKKHKWVAVWQGGRGAGAVESACDRHAAGCGHLE